jgi:hypothetical protein
MNAEDADLEARFAAPAERDLPPGRHNQHREILMNHMLTPSRQAEPAPARHPRHPRRRILAISGTAGIVVAVAAAVALVVTPAPASSHNAAAGGKAPAKTTQAAANPVLAQLAADITARQARLPGNATLEIRNQSPTSDKPGDNGVDWTPAKVGLWSQAAARRRVIWQLAATQAQARWRAGASRKELPCLPRSPGRTAILWASLLTSRSVLCAVMSAVRLDTDQNCNTLD